ncbi:hypothetical protein [Burkholderia stabilis]|uniref:hypothetical protein n=1 Tax=Burkholderia stabilis TaxID=95485 RepID=UPI0012FD29C9|nr:hypothetical protein [Burkholderia stabilis]
MLSRLVRFSSVAFALGSWILAHPPRVVERETCHGSVVDRTASGGAPGHPGLPKTFSAGFHPTPPYLIIRPERRAPAAIGHVDGMTRRQRLPSSDRRVARRTVDKTGNARPRVSRKK